MKRQPIASAAAFFVLGLLPVEWGGVVGESVWKAVAATDAIFCERVLYYGYQ